MLSRATKPLPLFPVPSQPDWFAITEILKDQAKLAYRYTIEACEIDVCEDNLVDPDSTIQAHIDYYVAGLQEVIATFACLGMPDYLKKELDQFYYLNLTKKGVLSQLSTDAKAMRKCKLRSRAKRQAGRLMKGPVQGFVQS